MSTSKLNRSTKVTGGGSLPVDHPSTSQPDAKNTFRRAAPVPGKAKELPQAVYPRRGRLRRVCNGAMAAESEE